MFGLPDAAIGVILAALIAGTISLLGLIISKEQKVSDFRQSWIDSLRTDLSLYITSVNAIHDSLKIKYENHAEKVKILSPLYSNLNTSTFNIQFRINPKEDRSKNILSAMNEISALMADEKKMTNDNIKPYEAKFIVSSQELLKFEWKRVKSGEWTFRIAKLSALALILASIAAVGSIAAHRLINPDHKVEPKNIEPHHQKSSAKEASPKGTQIKQGEHKSKSEPAASADKFIDGENNG